MKVPGFTCETSMQTPSVRNISSGSLVEARRAGTRIVVAKRIDVRADMLADQEVADMEADVALPAALRALVGQAIPECGHLVHVRIGDRHHVRDRAAEINDRARHS